MRSTCTPLVLAALLCRISASAAGEKQPVNLDDLGWMVGSWVERKGKVETEEHWIAAKGGLMLGVNRTVRASGKTSFEFLRIARTEKGISYFASPAGRPATEFPLIETSQKKAVFENPKHDFPQRIIYWLDKDGALRARIEGTLRGKASSQEWRWEKSK